MPQHNSQILDQSKTCKVLSQPPLLESAGLERLNEGALQQKDILYNWGRCGSSQEDIAYMQVYKEMNGLY